ncbi:hypothetical protein JM48_2688 [Lactiplantibacillus plantarum]|nr:hypothetical protein JM48_2688 [Lactiplantibacillus plantarum]
MDIKKCTLVALKCLFFKSLVVRKGKLVNLPKNGVQASATD